MSSTLPPVVRRQTIADALHRTALRLPDKTAIVCGDTRWTYADFDALVSRLAAGLAHLGVARTLWLGLSMGGMIGQVLALRHPAVLDRVVLADTTGQGAPNAAQMWADRAQAARASGMAALAEPTLARWFTEPFRLREPALMAQIGAMIAGTPVEGYAGCCAAIAGVSTLERLRSLGHPALVLVGDQDQGTPPAMAQRIAEHWPGATLKVLADAAHLANLEQAEVFNREVLGFLLAPARS